MHAWSECASALGLGIGEGVAPRCPTFKAIIETLDCEFSVDHRGIDRDYELSASPGAANDTPLNKKGPFIGTASGI